MANPQVSSAGAAQSAAAAAAAGGMGFDGTLLTGGQGAGNVGTAQKALLGQ
jgi:hypothetical protein